MQPRWRNPSECTNSIIFSMDQGSAYVSARHCACCSVTLQTAEGESKGGHRHATGRCW